MGRAGSGQVGDTSFDGVYVCIPVLELYENTVYSNIF